MDLILWCAPNKPMHTPFLSQRSISYSWAYTLSFPSSVHFFFCDAVPHFLINDPSWTLNQTHLFSHSHTQERLYIMLTSQTHIQIRFTHMTDGVQGQRDAMLVIRVTDLQYVSGICKSLCGFVCAI